MKRTKVVRGLRLAVSALCGILCLLLIMLWLRSLYWEDRISGHTTGSRGIRVYSSHGSLVYYDTEFPGAAKEYPWEINIGSTFWLEPNDVRVSSLPQVSHHKTTLWITVPYWLLLLGVTISAGAILWIPWRFSLRTLFIAATLVAFALGLFAWSISR
jgi:hypothetical protein